MARSIRFIRTARWLQITAIAAGALMLATAAEASPAGFSGIGRAVAPLAAHFDATMSITQETDRQQPPKVLDPAGGVVFSLVGGTIFSGSSAFQGGAAFAYFFGDKATFGFEFEGDIIFGPGGRIGQVMGSFVMQTGARTSKFVPYIALGLGYVRSQISFPTKTQDVLDQLGISPEPTTESAPFFQFGGGVRFYVKPNLAFRADLRFSQVVLDRPGRSFFESLYPMRRIAGMLSWDF